MANPNSRLSRKLLLVVPGVLVAIVVGFPTSDPPGHPVGHNEESQEMKPTRLKVKFPNEDAYRAGAAVDFPGAEVQLSSEQRRFVVLESAPAAAAQQAANMLQQQYGATIVEDYQYTVD